MENELIQFHSPFFFSNDLIFHSTSLMRHDIQHHFIRLIHGLRTDSCQITDAPVSYTHLDVYKRQKFNCAIFFFVFSFGDLRHPLLIDFIFYVIQISLSNGKRLHQMCIRDSSLNKNSMTHRKFSLKNTYPQAYLRK